MPAAYVLLKCIGKAVVKNVANVFTFGVGGDILVDAWEYWQAATKEQERPAQVEAVAGLSASELREEVARIVRAEAAALPPQQQAQVTAYLEQLPATVRRSLRRPSDLTGKTTVAGTAFRKPEDLAPLLPAGLPRFKRGDRPLPGVDWELVELLGVGGFGEVWKAHNPRLVDWPPVALKFCLDPTAKTRLLTHEAKIISQVMQQGKHEGIVPLLHAYLSADPPCLEYEYIDGGDLAGLIQGRKGRGLVGPQAAQVIQRLAEIVGFAHRLSPPVVHRDLKPANVLVKPRPGGKLGLRITDFGIGGLAIQQAVAHSRRASKHGEFLTAAVRGSYTPLYGSPQQMRGEDPDPRDDVYALGVIWHQLLTGDLTTGRPGGEAWKKRLTERGMTPALLALLASCFEDQREDRPGHGVELAEKLSRALAPPQAPKEKPTGSTRKVKPEPQRDGKRTGRLRSWLGIGGVVALLFLVLGGGYMLLGRRGYTPVPVSPTPRPRDKDVEVAETQEVVEGPPSPAPRPRDKGFTNSIGMKLALLPAGKFQMGSTDADTQAGEDEKPQHEVEITKPFYLGVYPVTKAQFAAFVSGTDYKTEAEQASEKDTWRTPNFPSKDHQADDEPVVEVTWNDAVAFCDWLSKKEGKIYKLPTEAEWEYACRAGTATVYFFGDDPKDLGKYAWFRDNAFDHTYLVGAKKPNPWGLYDMHGNVWEWCSDYYDPKYYKSRPKEDHENLTKSAARLCRGGAWSVNAGNCRAACRLWNAPGYRTYDFGLRVCFRLD